MFLVHFKYNFCDGTWDKNSYSSVQVSKKNKDIYGNILFYLFLVKAFKLHRQAASIEQSDLTNQARSYTFSALERTLLSAPMIYT